MNTLRFPIFVVLFLLGVLVLACTTIVDRSIAPISDPAMEAAVSPTTEVSTKEMTSETKTEDTVEMVVDEKTDNDNTSKIDETESFEEPLPEDISVPVDDNESTENSPQDTAISENVEPDIAIVYFIALNDNGLSGPAVGCGDSVVPVEVPGEKGIEPLLSAFEALLSIKESDFAGFHHSLDTADLILEYVSVENGEAIIFMSGFLPIYGVCHSPRIDAQLTYTALQFPEVERVSIYHNGYPLFCRFIEYPDKACELPHSFPGNEQTVYVYLINTEAGFFRPDAVGCGDRIEPYAIGIESTNAVLRASLEALLSLDRREYTYLENYLYDYEFELERLSVKEGEAFIFLRGEYVPYDTCDERRMYAQILHTALQFENIEKASIFINGDPLIIDEFD
jgi:hypothetical protein